MARRWLILWTCAAAVAVAFAQGLRKDRTVGPAPELATPAQATTVRTELTLIAEVRPSGDPDAEWTFLCKTPGVVKIAAGQELSLSPAWSEFWGSVLYDPADLRDAELEQLALDFAGTNLTRLDLTQTHVTNAGLVHLAGLTRLTRLDLHYCDGVTDAGLAHLAGLTHLTRLRLPSSVTDAGLVHLAGLTNLTRLGLKDARVTDAGLAHLEGLTELTTLDLQQTRVTRAGEVALREKLPGCEVYSAGYRTDYRACATRHTERGTRRGLDGDMTDMMGFYRPARSWRPR